MFVSCSTSVFPKARPCSEAAPGEILQGTLAQAALGRAGMEVTTALWGFLGRFLSLVPPPAWGGGKNWPRAMGTLVAIPRE